MIVRNRSAVRRTAAAAGVAAAMVGVVSVPALANHSWGGAHWARRAPVVIGLGDNVSSAWDTYLRGASADWTKADPFDTKVVVGGGSPATCPATKGRVEVCNAAYGLTGWTGIAQVWTSSGHIVQATAKLNDSYFLQAAYNTPANRRFVACQEIGHTFGLDHQDTNMTNLNLGSCMDYTKDPSGTRGTNGTLSNEHPNAHDYAMLKTLYGHADTTSTVASTSTMQAAAPAANGKAQRPNAGGNTPGEWGRAVAVSHGGRPRKFVRQIGPDEQIVTFVIWADDLPNPIEP